VDRGEQVLRPFRELAAPVADLSGVTRFVDVQRALDADYPNGMLYYWKSLYLDHLDDGVIASLSDLAAARPSKTSSLDIWGLGGALGRVAPQATPIERREAPFMLGIEANWTRQEDSDANIAWARKVFGEMQRHTRGGAYLNFPGFAEEGETLVRGAYGTNYERLRRVKAQYDPENLFCGNFNVTPG
jgi:FAD/FMN-containing dehydrogenase